MVGKSAKHWRFSGMCKTLFCKDTFTKDCNTSAARTKRRGDKGSPCLTPLLHLKVAPGIPFKSIAEEAMSEFAESKDTTEDQNL
jgi:hypothetical protein